MLTERDILRVLADHRRDILQELTKYRVKVPNPPKLFSATLRQIIRLISA